MSEVQSLVSQFNFLSMQAREIAISLLTRAVAQGRQQDMMEKIGQRLQRAHDMPEGHAEMLRLAEQWNGMAKGVRALNVLAMREGVAVFFQDEAAPVKRANPAFVAPEPRLVQ